MNITEVRLTKLEGSKALAIASITIDNDFVVQGLTVYGGDNGMWVSMPSKKNKEGSERKYSDICFPITKEAREHIKDSILAKYNELDNIAPPRRVEAQVTDNTKGYESNKKEFDSITEDDLPF